MREPVPICPRQGLWQNAPMRRRVELFAMLCKQYNLNPTADGVIVSHREGHSRGIASNHVTMAIRSIFGTVSAWDIPWMDSVRQ